MKYLLIIWNNVFFEQSDNTKNDNTKNPVSMDFKSSSNFYHKLVFWHSPKR